jgi:RHS repeat-associated protein
LLPSPNLTKVTYPTTYSQTGGSGQPISLIAGAIYEYSFDSMGRPTGETRTDPSSSPVAIVDQVTYNTFGALTQMRKTLASQTETRSYDSFQRLTSMTQFDGTAITYNYSATANDGKLVSQVTGSETVNYTYDSLGRLSQAATAGAGGWGLSWSYDGWGNRLQQAAVKGSVPTITTITDPATNRIQAHTYDANGNTVNTPLQGAMTYDVLNRLTTVASDTYGYDPSNKRVWKNDEFTFWGAGGERIGRYTVAKLVDPTSAHVFVFQKVSVDEYFGGRRLTTQDRLGSVGSYYPYGEAKSGSVSNADSFATYYRDSTGLDYADQRYYSVNGRFTTADRFRGSTDFVVGDSWNRYSYVLGDPVNRLDKNGQGDVSGPGSGYCVGAAMYDPECQQCPVGYILAYTPITGEPSCVPENGSPVYEPPPPRPSCQISIVSSGRPNRQNFVGLTPYSPLSNALGAYSTVGRSGIDKGLEGWFFAVQVQGFLFNDSDPSHWEATQSISLQGTITIEGIGGRRESMSIDDPRHDDSPASQAIYREKGILFWLDSPGFGKYQENGWTVVAADLTYSVTSTLIHPGSGASCSVSWSITLSSLSAGWRRN